MLELSTWAPRPRKLTASLVTQPSPPDTVSCACTIEAVVVTGHAAPRRRPSRDGGLRIGYTCKTIATSGADCSAIAIAARSTAPPPPITTMLCWAVIAGSRFVIAALVLQHLAVVECVPAWIRRGRADFAAAVQENLRSFGGRPSSSRSMWVIAVNQRGYPLQGAFCFGKCVVVATIVPLPVLARDPDHIQTMPGGASTV